MLPVVGTFHIDGDGPLLCIFHRVREQVVHDGGDDLRVEEHGRQVIIHVENGLYARVAVQFLEVQADFAHEVAHVATRHGEPPVLRFGLTELQDAVDEIAQALCVGEDGAHTAAVVLRQSAVVLQVFKWSENESERCAQFVGHIGEEAQPLLVEFLSLHVFLFLQFERVLQH